MYMADLDIFPVKLSLIDELLSVDLADTAFGFYEPHGSNELN